MGNLWHIKNWFRVGKNISWKLNFHTLFGFLYLSHPCEFFYNQSLKKHDFVVSYLKKDLADLIEKYKNAPEIDNHIASADEKNIWILWWQGVKTAPPLIKACINSTKRNCGDAKVIVITKDNYKDYIEIPNYILEKREKGYISFAQLSDIIRFLLLEKFGGLWLDATIFTSHTIPSEYFDYIFFTQHTHWKKTCFVQHNDYHCFIIGSKKHAKLVSFVKDSFLEYWKTHDTLVDYLMIDYLVMIAKTEFSDIANEISSLPWSSERLYDLVNILDEPFDKYYFENLSSECIFSKLDWHKKYKPNKKGLMTNYSYLLKEYT